MKKFLLTIFLLLPLFYLSYELFVLNSVNDPIKYIYTVTGVTATVLLFATTTLSLIRKWINLIKYRKIFGLMGFSYALLHLLNFVILDAELDFTFVIEESFDKPFIYLGMVAFFLLSFMAVTSTKTLYKKYGKYHKVLYIALILITIHFIMAQKSLSILQLIYILIILIIGYFKLLQNIIKRNNF